MARRINPAPELNKLQKRPNKITPTNSTLLSYHLSSQELLNAKMSSHVSYLKFLETTLEYIQTGKRVLTFPEILQRDISLFKNKFNNDFKLYRQSLSKSLLTHTEEHMGIDYKGNFYTKGKSVSVIIHGGGIITPEKVTKETEDSTCFTVSYSQDEFQYLLSGKAGVNLVSYTDFLNTKEELQYQSGIVIPTEEVIKQSRKQTFYTLPDLLNNPLAVAYAGSKELLKEFFSLGSFESTIPFCHGLFDLSYEESNKQPQGILIKLRNTKTRAIFTVEHVDSNINFLYATI